MEFVAGLAMVLGFFLIDFFQKRALLLTHRSLCTVFLKWQRTYVSWVCFPSW